jgi:hypothetical protein
MIIIFFKSCLIKYLHRTAEQRTSSAALEFGFRYISSKTRYSPQNIFFNDEDTPKTSTSTVAAIDFASPRPLLPHSATTAARTPGI